MSAFHHRLAMTRLIAEKIPCCIVSDIEERCQFDPSYSYRVLGALAEENPHWQLQLLIGQDSLEQLHSWYCARELVEQYEIIAFPRKNADGCAAELVLPGDFWGRNLQQKLHKSLIPGEYVEISSTNLRMELAKTSRAGNIINADVLTYIESNGLYR